MSLNQHINTETEDPMDESTVLPAEWCSNCLYAQLSDWDSNGRWNQLECRRNPPVVLPDGETRWPVVIDKGWCGEWKYSE
jgi:hypothetical protein